jgi:Dolichyl-phosphate-mannose-protein mannosyltransferase
MNNTHRAESFVTRTASALYAVPLDRWLLLAILAVGLVLRANHIDAIVDNYDEGVYTESLALLAAGHPLYSQIYHAQPPLFLYTLLPWFMLGGKTLVAARVGVAAYSLIGIIAAWYIGKTLGGTWVGIGTAALLAVDPVYLEQSRAVMAEAPALAAMLAALAIAIAAPRRIRFTILAGALFTVSMLIKLYTLPAIVPIAYYLLDRQQILAIIHDSQKHRRWPARTSWIAIWNANQQTILAFCAGCIIVLALSIVLIGGSIQAAWQQMIGLHVAATGSFAAARENNLTTFSDFGWEYLIIGAGLLAGILGLWIRAWHLVVITVWGLLCALALAIQTPLFSHHLVLLVPPFALAAAWLPDLIAQQVARYVPKFNMRLQIEQYAIIILIILLAASFSRSISTVNDAENHQAAGVILAAMDVQQFTTSDDLIMTDDQIIAVLADREVPPQVADTSNVRITSGQLKLDTLINVASDSHVHAIVWYSNRFSNVPGWREWVEARFTRIVDYGNGRALYLRAPPSQPLG